MAANKTDRGVNKMYVGLEPESKKESQIPLDAGSVPDPEVKKEPRAKDLGNRRRKFPDDAVTKFVSVQLLEDEIKFLEKYGGEFGGKTGYIRKLVQEEMSRVKGF